MTRFSWVLTIVLAVVTVAPGQAQAPDGAEVFRKHCAACHTGASRPRAPSREDLSRRSPGAILEALAESMLIPGSRLSGGERRAVAEYLAGRPIGGDLTGASVGRCTSATPLSDPTRSPHWNGWGADVANTRFQPADQAGLSPAQVPMLKLKWAFGFPDASMAWAQPTVVGNRVFVGSQNGHVYSLDAKTGCIYWAFSAKGGVRAAVSLGPVGGRAGMYAVYFADTTAHVYALDAATGNTLWVSKADSHPLARITGAPTLYRDRLYVPISSYEETQAENPEYGCCTFRGNVAALNAATGEIVWKAYTIPERPKVRGKNAAGVRLWGPSGGSIWSSPTGDPKRRAVYVATSNGYSNPPQPTTGAVLAFDLDTGRLKWSSQMAPRGLGVTGCQPGDAKCDPEAAQAFEFGSSPILATDQNGRDLLIAPQKSGIGWALDPDHRGAVVWQYRAGEGGSMGGMQWGSAADDERVYFPVADFDSALPGGLHAVRLDTGQGVWNTPPQPPKCLTRADSRACSGGQGAAISVIPGVVFSGSNDGAIRAYSTTDGSMMWEYDTNREFETVNRVKANGGSINGPGPTIVDGMLYINSGYGAFGFRAGNVLLAFRVD